MTSHPLLWKKFPILNDGFICLSDFMGNDAKIASRARTSYGNDTRVDQQTQAFKKAFPNEPEPTTIRRNWKDGYLATSDQTFYEGTCHAAAIHLFDQELSKLEREQPQKDTDLIRRLMRDRHTSPFEFCQVEFLVRAPIYVFRQWHRHRTASINEYSGRYKEMIDSMETTPPGKWRLQSGKNKQGSDGYLRDWPEGFALTENAQTILYGRKGTPGEHLTYREGEIQQHLEEIYQERLALGVAKEQARKDLPVSNYSEMYWSCDLHNLLHFLTLRMDSHAQEEIRLYANQMGEIVKELFPVTWQAFEDYRLNAMTLTALDIIVVQKLLGSSVSDFDEAYVTIKDTILESVFTNKTEREECVTKLTKLGIL